MPSSRAYAQCRAIHLSINRHRVPANESHTPWGNLKCPTILLRNIQEALRDLAYVGRLGLSIHGDMQNIAFKMHFGHVIISFPG